MARKRKRSDDLYNARRRYRRAGDRYMKRAESASGNQAERLRFLASQEYRKAAELYENKAAQTKFSIKAEKRTDEIILPFVRKKGDKTFTQSEIEQIGQESFSALETFLEDPAERRARESRAIMSSRIGDYVYAGTMDIWNRSDIAYSDRNQAILDAFGASDMMEVIEIIDERTGGELFASDKGNQYKYDELTTLIMSML